MLSAPRRIAREEWRFWRRSKLMLAASVVVVFLVITALITTTGRISSEQTQRREMQTIAEDTFKSQPARHPHRMVHYGHYVFRTPTPLAAIDPGVDAYAGTVMFLEGHRQNSAVFSPFYTAAQTPHLAQLTPARAYLLLLPLVLILAGYASVTRERAAHTDRMLLMSDLTPGAIVLGKVLAMLQLTGVLLIPLAGALIVLVVKGACPIASSILFIGFALYLAVWSLLTVAVSRFASNASRAVLVLLSLWVGLGLILPAASARLATTITPTHGKIETDLDVVSALKDKGDGHNANDPAFEKIRTNLLTQYNVETVEELPVNIRGIVAEAAEAEQAVIMSEFAEDHWSEERAQAVTARQLGWLSPALAMRAVSMIMVGTDIDQHHQFQRDAEASRLEFVQALNRLQAEGITYADDISRSNDRAAEKRTRVDASNWQRLRTFELKPPPVFARMGAAAPYFAMLTLWLIAVTVVLMRSARTLGHDHG
ncbi:MAG: DUF3526 domain-containing protein [Pseudomonadota bacterium]